VTAHDSAKGRGTERRPGSSPARAPRSGHPPDADVAFPALMRTSVLYISLAQRPAFAGAQAFGRMRVDVNTLPQPAT